MGRWWSRYPRSASGWFTRLHKDAANSATDSQFQRWLTADPRNEERYDQQELLWKLAGELAHDPDIDALVEQAGTDAPAASSTRGRYIRMGIVAVACVIGLTAIGLVVALIHADHREQLYATSIGEEREIVLPDHSAMMLNTATRVRVSYGKSRRSVVLEQGEATFNVANDPARPFEVAAAGGTARALGTQFNVLASAGTITVAVLEGRVAVSTVPNARGGTTIRPATVVVAGGEQVSYAGAELDRPVPANIARIRGWHVGRIVLNDMALTDAIAEFNRYSRIPLRLGNPSLATHRVTGVFRSGETDAFLDALEEAFGLRVERADTSITLL